VSNETLVLKPIVSELDCDVRRTATLTLHLYVLHVHGWT